MQCQGNLKLEKERYELELVQRGLWEIRTWAVFKGSIGFGSAERRGGVGILVKEGAGMLKPRSLPFLSDLSLLVPVAVIGPTQSPKALSEVFPGQSYFMPPTSSCSSLPPVHPGFQIAPISSPHPFIFLLCSSYLEWFPPIYVGYSFFSFIFQLEHQIISQHFQILRVFCCFPVLA